MQIKIKSMAFCLNDVNGLREKSFAAKYFNSFSIMDVVRHLNSF